MPVAPLKGHHNGHFTVFYWKVSLEDPEQRWALAHQFVFSDNETTTRRT